MWLLWVCACQCVASLVCVGVCLCARTHVWLYVMCACEVRRGVLLNACTCMCVQLHACVCMYACMYVCVLV